MNFPRTADYNDISTFFGVASRPATPEEASIWPEDEIDGPVLVHETPVQDGRRIKYTYVDISDRYVQVDLDVENRIVSDFSFSSPRILIGTEANPDLILFSGSSVLNISKNPWQLSGSQDSFYENTDWNSSEPW